MKKTHLLSIILTILFFTLFIVSCTAPYIFPNEDNITDTVITTCFIDKVKDFKHEISWFQQQGNNPWGVWTNVFAAVEIVLGGVISAVAVTSIRGKGSRTKALISLALSIVVIAASGGLMFVKAENERYFSENHNQYIALSERMDTLVDSYVLEFNAKGFNDGNINNRLPEFTEFVTRMNNEVEQLKLEYFDKYGLKIIAPN